MSDETTPRVCVHCGEPTEAGHHVGGYCYCGDRLNQWLLIEAEPSPAPQAPGQSGWLQRTAIRVRDEATELPRLRERCTELESALTTAREERDRAREALREAEGELRQERGMKALLANGMPPTGNPDFDKVLATHPIAAMIQRGWLVGVTGFDDLPMLEAAICKFYEVATIAEAVNPKWPVSDRQPQGETK